MAFIITPSAVGRVFIWDVALWCSRDFKADISLNRLENLRRKFFFSAGLKITTMIRPRFRCATNRKLLQTHKQMQLQHGSCNVLAVSVEEVDGIFAFKKRGEKR